MARVWPGCLALSANLSTYALYGLLNVYFIERESSMFYHSFDIQFKSPWLKRVMLLSLSELISLPDHS